MYLIKKKETIVNRKPIKSITNLVVISSVKKEQAKYIFAIITAVNGGFILLLNNLFNHCF